MRALIRRGSGINKGTQQNEFKRGGRVGACEFGEGCAQHESTQPLTLLPHETRSKLSRPGQSGPALSKCRMAGVQESGCSKKTNVKKNGESRGPGVSRGGPGSFRGRSRGGRSRLSGTRSKGFGRKNG